LVNIYKNDLVEQDLQKYAQRLTNLSRTCQICTPTSFVRKHSFIEIQTHKQISILDDV